MDETSIGHLGSVDINSINEITNDNNIYNHININNPINTTNEVHTPYIGNIDIEKIIENKNESDNVQREGVKDLNDKEKDNKI